MWFIRVYKKLGGNFMKWKERLTNKTFWVALTSALILLSQQLGVQLPENIAEITNTVLSIVVILGIVIDPTTPGIGD